jgi:hypothetical protein
VLRVPIILNAYRQRRDGHPRRNLWPRTRRWNRAAGSAVPAWLNHINDVTPPDPADARLVHVGKAALDVPVAGAGELRPRWWDQPI